MKLRKNIRIFLLDQSNSSSLSYFIIFQCLVSNRYSIQIDIHYGIEPTIDLIEN